jgi:hypothetical protein
MVVHKASVKTKSKVVNGYLYLIKNIAKGYEAYKIGHTKTGDNDDRILTHLSLGWELVALWKFDELYDAQSSEVVVLSDWRNTLKVLPGLKPIQMKIQKGHTETANIKELVEAILELLHSSSNYSSPCDILHPDKIVVDRIDLIITKHINSLYPNTIKIPRPQWGPVPRTQINRQVEIRHQRVLGSVWLQSGVQFKEDSSHYRIELNNSKKNCGCTIPIPTKLDDASPEIPPYTALTSRLFSKGSEARRTLYSDAVDSLVYLHKANNDPEPKISKNGKIIPNQFEGLIKDTNGYNATAIAKVVRLSPRGKIRYAHLDEYVLARCISAVLHDKELGKDNPAEINKNVVGGMRNRAGFEIKASYWVCGNWRSL